MTYQYKIVIHPFHNNANTPFVSDNLLENELSALGAQGFDLFSTEIAQVKRGHGAQLFETPAIIFTLRRIINN